MQVRHQRIKTFRSYALQMEHTSSGVICLDHNELIRFSAGAAADVSICGDLTVVSEKINHLHDRVLVVSGIAPFQKGTVTFADQNSEISVELQFNAPQPAYVAVIFGTDNGNQLWDQPCWIVRIKKQLNLPLFATPALAVGSRMVIPKDFLTDHQLGDFIAFTAEDYPREISPQDYQIK